MYLNHPRGFRDDNVLEERRVMLGASSRSEPLHAWVADLARAKGVVPDFDPADAGSKARVLLLFEAPGPMTNTAGKRAGSGFVSADNNDATAENLWHARDAVGLTDGVLCWNIVPWYLGAASRKPTVAELRDGGVALHDLLTRLLSEVHTVVACGRYAQRGWREFARPGSSMGIRTIDTWHPSPLSMNQKGHRADFVAALGRARNDWRGNAKPRELQLDTDSSGRTMAQWYSDDAGDRIDIHPRWWNAPFD